MKVISYSFSGNYNLPGIEKLGNDRTLTHPALAARSPPLEDIAVATPKSTGDAHPTPVFPGPGYSWHLAQGSHWSLRILNQMRKQTQQLLGMVMPYLYGIACLLGR